MRPSLHGMLIIDKPAGWSSHDVVGWVRRWTGERKVGHAGTLDPAATGVLPVAVNDGTRILEFLSDKSKAYVAEIRFGVETDSADGDGRVIGTGDVAFADAALADAVAEFRGPIRQRPPAQSAIRIGGKRAYELARAGVEIEMPERAVVINALEILDWNGQDLRLFIDCTKGTYIRSIARDLGHALGTCAYLANLVRTRSGPYCLRDAWTVGELGACNPIAEWPTLAEHPDSALPEWPAIVLDDGDAAAWQHGQPIAAATSRGHMRARVYDNLGQWRGLATLDELAHRWTPLRVINPS